MLGRRHVEVGEVVVAQQVADHGVLLQLKLLELSQVVHNNLVLIIYR